MTLRFCSLFLFLASVANGRADLTIVQAVDVPGASANQITIFTKGDKIRIDTAPQMSTIMDGKSGETVTLLKEQKCAVHISAAKMKAAGEMIKQFTSDKNGSAEPAKPKPTGRKETIRGYKAEEYVLDRGALKASYWLAPNFPDGASILRQLQAMKPEVLGSASPGDTGFRDFPALPIRTVVEMGARRMTTELVSVKQDPLPDTTFAIPSDYREVKGPEMMLPGQAAPATASSPR